MGMFTLCGVLTTLRWGGVTSLLIITTKAWTTKPLKENLNASTNTETLSSRGASRLLKPTSVSFRDERARWEWPRRTVPVSRRVRRARAWGVNYGQAGWGECNRQ
jgi:hypothetical protein